MKYINKFIAMGLGFALVFTATSFSQGWFKSECSKENCIIITGYESKSAFYYRDTFAENNDYIYIPIEYVDGVESVTNATLTSNGTTITFKAAEKGDKTIQVMPAENDGRLDKINCSTHKLDSTAIKNYYIRLNDNMDSILDDYTDYKLSITVTLEDGGTKEYKYNMEISNHRCYKNLPILPSITINTVNIKPYTPWNTLNEVLEVPNQSDIIELPSEPEVVEPPRVEEEVEQSEPEVVEPPRVEEEVEQSEPEVVEPPRVEEEVEQSEPEIVEPPKFEYEILTSEPDVVELPKTEDVVAQKKEEIEE